MRALPLLLLVTAAVLPGCRQNPPPADLRGAGGDPAPPEPPPPPEPVEAPFSAAPIGEDGSRRVLDGTNAVPPPERIELESEIAFDEVRVRLLDGRDRLVPSSDTIAIGQGTRVRITPQETLEAGRSYKLRVDAVEGSPTDIEGTDYLPRTIDFRIAEEDTGAGGTGAP